MADVLGGLELAESSERQSGGACQVEMGALRGLQLGGVGEHEVNVKSLCPLVGGRVIVGAAGKVAIATQIGGESAHIVRKSLRVRHAKNRKRQSVGGESRGDGLHFEVRKVPLEVGVRGGDDVVADIEEGDVLVFENCAQEGVEASLLDGLYAALGLFAAEAAASGGKSEASLCGRECAGKRAKHNVAWLGVAEDELLAERDTVLLWGATLSDV